MKLKAVLSSEEFEKLEEQYKQFYVEADGKFVLDAEGVEDVSGLKSALESERKERKNLAKQLADLTTKLGDADPEKAAEALKKLQELEDKNLLDEGKVDELVAKRVERMKVDYENQIKAFNNTLETSKQETEKLNSRLSEVLIDNALREAAVKAKVRPTAIADALLRGKQVFRLQDGVPTPLNTSGEVVFGKDPNKPMTMAEWLESLTQEAPHLFEGSSGGGARNEPSAGNSKIVRLTREQAKDPAQYRAAKAQAEKVGGSIEIIAT